MERFLLAKLKEWKEMPNRKPLILKGVRQCGKTYLLKEFGRRFYEKVVYINFEEMESVRSVFDRDYDVRRILFELGLFAEYRKKYLPRYAVKTSMRPDTDGEDVLNVPLYMIGAMKNRIV